MFIKAHWKGFVIDLKAILGVGAGVSKKVRFINANPVNSLMIKYDIGKKKYDISLDCEELFWFSVLQQW